MTCIVFSLLNLLQPVFVELLGLVFDHQSLYLSPICCLPVICDPLRASFEQVSKFVALHPLLVLQSFPSFKASLLCITTIFSSLLTLCSLGTERLRFLCNNNNILDYGLLFPEPTFLTETSILIENPFKGKEEDVEETRGRKLSFFMTMIIHVFSGKGSTEETLYLVICLQLLLLINVTSLAFFLPTNKEYLDNRFSRFYGLWLQKWVKITKKNKKEKNSFLFKDSTFSREREKISWSILFSALLLCFAVLYIICKIR